MSKFKQAEIELSVLGVRGSNSPGILNGPISPLITAKLEDEKTIRNQAKDKFNTALAIFEAAVKVLEKDALSLYAFFTYSVPGKVLIAAQARKLHSHLEKQGTEFFANPSLDSQKKEFWEKCQKTIDEVRPILAKHPTLGSALFNLMVGIYNTMMDFIYPAGKIQPSKPSAQIALEELESNFSSSRPEANLS